MKTTKPNNLTTADAPFHDPNDNVDLVIRTADNVDFFVLSVLLSLRSPSSFFRHVLQSSQNTEEREGLPVLEVDEDSDTFRIILLLCYPYTAPEINSIQKLVDVGKALREYSLDNALERFLQTVIASYLIREHPFHVFVHAVSNGWRILGEAAARQTLTRPLDFDFGVLFEDLKLINAFQYVTFRDYHERCSVAVQAITSKFGWTSMPWSEGKTTEIWTPSTGQTCLKCGQRTGLVLRAGDQNFVVHFWLWDYIVAVKSGLSRQPCREIALDEDIIGQAVTKSISECKNAEWARNAGSQVHLFATLVAEEIDRLISQVPLNINWAK